MSHICCSLWCNFYITKTWTGLPSFSGAPLCKKAQNNHTNKVCVSPALVTCFWHNALLLLSYTSKKPFRNCSWSRMETREFPPGLTAGALQVWIYSKAEQDSKIWSWPGRFLLLKMFYSMNLQPEAGKPSGLRLSFLHLAFNTFNCFLAWASSAASFQWPKQMEICATSDNFIFKTFAFRVSWKFQSYRAFYWFYSQPNFNLSHQLSLSVQSQEKETSVLKKSPSNWRESIS